jgi:hypothetical protein
MGIGTTVVRADWLALGSMWVAPTGLLTRVICVFVKPSFVASGWG